MADIGSGNYSALLGGMQQQQNQIVTQHTRLHQQAVLNMQQQHQAISNYKMMVFQQRTRGYEAMPPTERERAEEEFRSWVVSEMWFGR